MGLERTQELGVPRIPRQSSKILTLQERIDRAREERELRERRNKPKRQPISLDELKKLLGG